MKITRRALSRAGVRLPEGARVVTDATPLPIARGIKRAPAMNRTEAAYGEVLAARQASGEVVAYWFQGVTLKLGDDCRYTPDYFVMLADDSLECHEVKGFMRDDALVKVKVAARLYPFLFRVVRKVKGGGFTIDAVKP